MELISVPILCLFFQVKKTSTGKKKEKKFKFLQHEGFPTAVQLLPVLELSFYKRSLPHSV